MSCWMTHEQALRYAAAEAAASGWRYRVYKTRSVVNWWNAVQTGERVTDWRARKRLQRLRARAASMRRP